MKAPPPPEELSPKLYRWPAGQQFVRCHHSRFGSTEFNPDPGVSSRFRPFVARRRTVATLYGSKSVEGALSETLFQAVPTAGPDRRVRLSSLGAWSISYLEPLRELRLADLRDPALAAIGMTREELIESPATAYPQTAAWAEALYRSPLAPDGLIWNARQGRRDPAIVLFERDRVARSELEVAERPESMAAGRGADLAYAVAEELEITLIA